MEIKKVTDLQEMDIVKSRDGRFHWILKDETGDLCVYNDSLALCAKLSEYNDDFSFKDKNKSDLDIVKVARVSNRRALVIMNDYSEAIRKPGIESFEIMNGSKSLPVWIKVNE